MVEKTSFSFRETLGRRLATGGVIACAALGAVALEVESVAARPYVRHTPVAAPARSLSPENFGINFNGTPTDLDVASAAGVGLARDQIIVGSDTDAVVELTASADLRLYPVLGLPESEGAPADASAMAMFVTDFAERYGPDGSFWAEHPELPYLPVTQYEIGNEPDISPTHPADKVSLHYGNPKDYALVYETARTALHQVNPRLVAVVGGLLDSGKVNLQDAERYLRPLTKVDAIGFHPYLYNPAEMEQDTMSLRRWLNHHHLNQVPIEINEFDAPYNIVPNIKVWGRDVAYYTRWALCTPNLGVENVQAFWWGDNPAAESADPETTPGASPWYPMIDNTGAVTPLGRAFMGQTSKLLAEGC